MTLKRVRRKKRIREKEDPVNLHHPLNLMEGRLTWALFVYDLWTLWIPPFYRYVVHLMCMTFYFLFLMMQGIFFFPPYNTDNWCNMLVTIKILMIVVQLIFPWEDNRITAFCFSNYCKILRSPQHAELDIQPWATLVLVFVLQARGPHAIKLSEKKILCVVAVSVHFIHLGLGYAWRQTWLVYWILDGRFVEFSTVVILRSC